MERLKALGSQLLGIWQQLGINQKITVGASGLLVVGARWEGRSCGLWVRF